MKSIVKACFVWAALSSTPAMAADLVSAAAAPGTAPAAEGGWTYTITPYFWAAGLSGKTSQFNSPVLDIHSDFGDILDHLDFAAMAIGEARNGRYSLFGDLMYTNLSGSKGTPRGVLATSGKLDTSTFAGTAGAGYALLEGPAGHLDMVGGVRVWSVNTDISFSGGLLDGKKFSDSATWVDGLVGFKGTYAFTPNFYAVGWGMVGAGGADVDWDVMAGIGYNFNETFSATLGYRALGVDYSNDGFLFNVVEQGPIAGLTIHF